MFKRHKKTPFEDLTPLHSEEVAMLLADFNHLPEFPIDHAERLLRRLKSEEPDEGISAVISTSEGYFHLGAVKGRQRGISKSTAYITVQFEDVEIYGSATLYRMYVRDHGKAIKCESLPANLISGDLLQLEFKENLRCK